jgi:hypothetical protein
MTEDVLVVGAHTLHSRLIVGTGKYKDVEQTRAAMALSPYPTELERMLTLSSPLPEGDQFLLRPVRPDDASRFAANFKRLMPEDVRSRFFTSMNRGRSG